MIVDKADDWGSGGCQLVMVICPLCGAEKGTDYEKYPAHLRKQHTWSDLSLDARQSTPGTKQGAA